MGVRGWGWLVVVQAVSDPVKLLSRMNRKLSNVALVSNGAGPFSHKWCVCY